MAVMEGVAGAAGYLIYRVNVSRYCSSFIAQEKAKC